MLKAFGNTTDNKDMMDLSIKVDNLLKGAFNEIS